MYGTLIERLTDISVSGYLWAFRIAVILLVLIGSILTLQTGDYQAVTWLALAKDGVVTGSVFALIALGYTMVYGILRMINFAHGEIFIGGAFGGYFAAQALSQLGFLNANLFMALLSVVIMLAVAMTVSVTIALLVERIAYRPLRNAPRLVPLISAIGASYFLQYTYAGFFGTGIYAYPSVNVLTQELPIGIIRLKWVEVLVMVAAVLMMAGLYLFVMRTKTGTAIRAVSEDKGTAALMGIDVNRAIVVTFGLGAAMAGAAGVLWSLLFQNFNFFSGFFPGIKAFTAAVLGGIGNIPGAMLGGLLLGTVESIGPQLFLHGLDVPGANTMKDVIAFTMLVLILIFRPSGILGERIARQRA
jgi:branched-chain amino acid transport system permease protein